MSIPRRLLPGLALLPAAPALAQGFPERPITLVTGFAPGGSTDIASRLISERFAANIGPGARMVVENRPGASGTVAADWLRRQAPDGHTIMLIEVSSHAIAPAALQGGTPFDPVGDFTQIGLVGTAPLILITQPSFPARTAPEAVARLRASRPEEFAYATSGVGSIPHLAVEMLGAAIGARFTHVPYRSGGLMLTAIHQGEGQFGIAVLASAAAQVRDGMVRGLAVTSRERFPSFPDVPTLHESALPGFEMTTWNMIIGPPRMNPAILATLNRALAATVAEEPVRERLLGAGVSAWSGANTPEVARDFLQGEVRKYQEVVARTGIRLER
ncbi:Bug family tripartite tricarboxylate transporter substrate binding protein [Roseococcus sp. DSY-14]|uniref:Bug family tripartite tricarboxylate transporter substrate binding protein n=1 Tax=Roseococcus sp. DSY-14 TaxID=3369650 RepID=UPI00387B38E0